MWSLRQSGGIQLPHLTVTEVKFGMLTENPNLDLVIRTVSLQGGGNILRIMLTFQTYTMYKQMAE